MAGLFFRSIQVFSLGITIVSLFETTHLPGYSLWALRTQNLKSGRVNPGTGRGHTHLPKHKNTNSKRYIHPTVYSTTIYNSQNMETTQVSIS